MVHGYEGARCFEVLRFNWVMGNYQLKNMSLYTIICLTGLTSSQLQVPIHSNLTVIGVIITFYLPRVKATPELILKADL